MTGHLLPSRRLELAAVEGGVKAVPGHQFPVGAPLHDVAVPHHQDQIRAADGGQAVGDDKAGLALH